MKCKTIESVQNLVQVLKEDFTGYNEDVWYRGQANFSWNLLPGLMRDGNQHLENLLLTRFKQSAAMLIDGSPNNDFDWLFLMQHYGVPTRLLDWSESPLVALYFAIQSEEEEDAALWALKPIELNKSSGISADERNFIPSFEDDLLKNYSVEILHQNQKLELLPIATIATRNSPRIQAQSGVFSIHHRDNKPIEEICGDGQVYKYQISAKHKPVIKKELDLLGVNKFSLFPELSSIGEIINEKIL